MSNFQYSFSVNEKLEHVRNFHSDPRALKDLTPPPIFLSIHQIEPLAEGSNSKFTLWFGPLPIRWHAQHKNVNDSGFTDVQISGPMRTWEHSHRFESVSANETVIHEHIEYQHFYGLRGLFTRLLFCKPGLYLLFTARKFLTRMHLRGKKEPSKS